MNTVISKEQINIPNTSINTTQNQAAKNTPTPKDNSILDLTELHQDADTLMQKNDISSSQAVFKNDNKSSNQDPSKFGFIEKFLHDNNPWRIGFSLGNEIAESFKDLAEHLLPKPIAMLLYGSFWSAALVSTGNRIYSNANHASKEDKVKNGAKMLLHDGISTLGGTTVWAKFINFVQSKLYHSVPVPETLKHLVKSVITLFTCKHVIHALDPYALKFSKWATGVINDRYQEINEALGSSH